MKYCVIIPVYNSKNHIADVINSVLHYADNLIVVNDGSTDGTVEILNAPTMQNKFELVSIAKNMGKGYALRQGFHRALQLGFTHAVTLDADGQHLAGDIPLVMQKAIENPEGLIIGSRKFNNPNMPRANIFANKFSIFWFMVQTGRKLPDTQTGFRVYPLRKIETIRLFTNRYETELELLVRSAWRNIPLIPQTINVYYPPKNERISHFRHFRDFFRISILNTVLCFYATIWFYPAMLLKKILGI